MLSKINIKNNIEIRKAENNEVYEIFKILEIAFKPYYIPNTTEAYNATVPSPHEIKSRIEDPKTEILVAVYKNKIVGTASIELQNKQKLYIRTMAVKPIFQGGGIGQRLLKEINRLAKEKHATTISLECSSHLAKAVKLYNKFGFKKSEKKRIYQGLEIFEMKKDIS